MCIRDSTTVVARLTKVTPLKVEFAVPERYAREIKKGTNLEFKVEGKLDTYHAQVYATESSICLLYTSRCV